MTAIAAPDRPQLTRARISVTALFAVLGAGAGVWAAHIPVLKAGLGLADDALGLVLLALGVGALVAMPIAAALVHRFGAAAVAVWGGLAYAAAFAVPPLAPTAPLLALGAFAIGVGFGVLAIAINAHAGAIERAWGRPIMSSVHGFFSVGGLIGAGAGAGLIALGAGARVDMALSAAALIAVVAAASARIRLPLGDDADAGPVFRKPTPALMGIGVLVMCSFLCEGAMMEWSAVFLREAAGAPLALAASGYAASSAAMATGRLVGDGVVSRFGRRATVQASGALAAASLTLIILAPNPWAAYAGVILTGFGLANIVPALFSAATRVAGVQPAAAIAMVSTVGYGGQLAGPPAIGFLSHAFGLRVGFLVLVVAALTIAVGAGFALSRREPPRRG